MAKTLLTKIDRFDGGVSSDLRETSSRAFAISKHFNTFSNPKKLTPYRDLEANEDKTFNIIKFLQVNSNVYGFGVVVGGAAAKVYKKTGGMIAGPWTEDQNVEGSGARDERVFFHYKDYIYMWEATARLIRHGDITGTATNATFQTISFTDVAQPIHHPADDIAYFFADNVVYSYDGSTWATGITLPTNLIITSGAAYGNYLAIGCRDKNATGHSVVFLWDRDSSVTTLSEKIDWGSGGLELIGVIDGTLFGLSNVGTDSTLGILSKLHIKQLSGNQALLIKEIDLDSASTGDTSYSIPSIKKKRGNVVVADNKLYFALDSGDSTNARNLTGIWVVGRHEVGTPFAVTMAYKVNTDAASPSDQIEGFNLFQDYLFVAHGSDGSVDRTNDTALYTETSVYESQIFNLGDSSQKKKLVSATVTNVYLPTAGQVVLKYRLNEETSYTTIFTNSVDNSISHTAVNIESSGVTLPEFKEIQFRIESTGGAEITGLKFKTEDVNDDIT